MNIKIRESSALCRVLPNMQERTQNFIDSAKDDDANTTDTASFVLALRVLIRSNNESISTVNPLRVSLKRGRTQVPSCTFVEFVDSRRGEAAKRQRQTATGVALVSVSDPLLDCNDLYSPTADINDEADGNGNTISIGIDGGSPSAPIELWDDAENTIAEPKSLTTCRDIGSGSGLNTDPLLMLRAAISKMDGDAALMWAGVHLRALAEAQTVARRFHREEAARHHAEGKDSLLLGSRVASGLIQNTGVGVTVVNAGAEI